MGRAVEVQVLGCVGFEPTTGSAPTLITRAHQAAQEYAPSQTTRPMAPIRAAASN